MKTKMNVALFLLSFTVAVSHAESVTSIYSAPGQMPQPRNRVTSPVPPSPMIPPTANAEPCYWNGGVTPPTPPHPLPIPPPHYPLPLPPNEPRRYDFLESAERFCPNLTETRNGTSLTVEYSWAELAPTNSIRFQFVNDGRGLSQMTNFDLNSLPCHNVLSRNYRASAISVSAAGVKVEYLPGNSLNH